ncbi:hypothetical protein KAK25_00050 [Pseudomonas phage vB_Pae-Kakheti25]|uniref:Uncharacterized protein n=1 Tax=Pseudomonas phage vB_Pae-Kakheti25 TaxID=1141526 RepID=H6WU38_9CAUD|nr:hypothetical protein KAK25_00050 [Pseudomonas phage vB_Pae-Kakheti25]AFB83338.1 hypothetical protein KAK25_00050 [Pseudomonas phage vB_Pae-Kakheti25]
MKKTDEELIDEARSIARSKRCFVVTKSGYWLLYRESVPRNVCVGKRSSASALLQLAKKA